MKCFTNDRDMNKYFQKTNNKQYDFFIILNFKHRNTKGAMETCVKSTL